MTLAKEGVVSYPVFVFDGCQFSTRHLPLIQEVSLQVYFDAQHLASIACTGLHMEELAIGYLRSEGLISEAADIRDVRTLAEEAAVHVFTASGGTPGREQALYRGSIGSSGARSRLCEDIQGRCKPIAGDGIRLSPEKILHLMDIFIGHCRLHAMTRGTHGAALTDGEGILAVREDIGRHNALDMLAGYALMGGLNCSDKAVLRTGRVSAEIVHKVWRLGIPIIVSLAVPTARALELALEAGITVVGSVRNRSMNIYTHERRIGP